jgi:hypothetical protein
MSVYAIPIGQYLSSVPDAALDRLHALANEKIVSVAPRFAAWILDTVDEERVRRIRTETGTPREPAMPSLNMGLWSDTEVAEALIAANVTVSVVVDPAAREFMDRVNLIVVAEAAHRLERSDLTTKEDTA